MIADHRFDGDAMIGVDLVSLIVGSVSRKCVNAIVMDRGVATLSTWWRNTTQ
jgi:hypothetical protein